MESHSFVPDRIIISSIRSLSTSDRMCGHRFVVHFGTLAGTQRLLSIASRRLLATYYKILISTMALKARNHTYDRIEINLAP